MFLTNNKEIKEYRQITVLSRFTNCKLDKIPYDINSLIFWFDSINDVIPNKFTVREDGKQIVEYEDIKIVKIVDDILLNKTYDSNGNYLLYYEDDYVKQNYSRFIEPQEKLKDLVGCYIIDWKYNSDLISEIKEKSSQYIEMNYYI